MRLTCASPSAITLERKSALVGTIARALAVFCVDEVIVFNDTGTSVAEDDESHGHGSSAYTGDISPVTFFARLLSYLETPPYLRRTLFPHHPDLAAGGSLPSLDMPHHARIPKCLYREGVTLAADAAEANGNVNRKTKTHAAAEEATTLVNAGLHEPLQVSGAIPEGARVTLRLDTKAPPVATPVDPAAPRAEVGWYWGYSVRTAPALSAVLTEAPWPDGYDLVVGTSERGTPLEDILSRAAGRDAGAWRSYEHLLVCFGGLAGLEEAVGNDAVLREKGVGEAAELFDYWVDLCPGQGSRTVRTEEAVWMGLMGLRPVVMERAQRK